MLGTTTTAEAVQLDLVDNVSRIEFLHDQSDGIVSGLEVQWENTALILQPGEFRMHGTYVKLERKTLAPISTTLPHHGFVVIEAARTAVQDKDGYGISRDVRFDNVFTPRVVATVDPAKHLLCGVYHVVLREALNSDGSVQMTTEAVSITSAPVNDTIYTKKRGLSGIVVTQGGNACTFSNTPQTLQYWVDAAAGVFRFSQDDRAKVFQLDFDAEVPVMVIDRYVDNARLDYPTNRPVFTQEDIRHAAGNTRSTGNNPHGTGFNDVAGDVPLHRMVYDSGFCVYDPANRSGVPGTIVTREFPAFPFMDSIGNDVHGYDTDLFGEDTGVLGDQYIVLPNHPLRILSVQDQSGQAVWYRQYLDRICFPSDTDFTQANGDPTVLSVTYAEIVDFAPHVSFGNRITLAANNTHTVFSAGMELSQSDTAVEIDFSKYPVPVPVRVAIDGSAKAVISPGFVDSARVSTGSRLASPVTLPYASRLSVTCKDTPVRTALLPPTGTLEVTSDAASVFGTWRFMYAYYRGAKTRVSRNLTSTPAAIAENNNGVLVYRDPDIVIDALNNIVSFSGGTLLDSTSFRVLDDVAALVLARDVYEAYSESTFLMHVPEATSSRNTSDWIELVGSASTAKSTSGSRAIGRIDTTGAAFTHGDQITVRLPDGTQVARTYADPALTFQGDDVNTLSVSLAARLVSHPALTLYGVTVQVETDGSVVVSLPLNQAVSTLGITAGSSTGMLRCVTQQSPDAATGTAYIARITFLSANLGDAWIQFAPDTSTPIRFQFVDAARGFTGATTSDVWINAAAAFAADASLQRAGFAVTAASGIVFTAPAGSSWNATTLSVQQALATYAVTQFTGGADASSAPSLDELHGVSLRLVDGYEYDPNGVFVIYATKEITNGGSKTEFFRVGEVAQIEGTPVYDVTLAAMASPVSNRSSYSIADEFNVTVQISGTDASGAALVETVTITPLEFCEYTPRALGRENPLQFVRTESMFKTVTSWTVVNKTAAGDCSVVVLADTVAGVRGFFPVFSAFWTGQGLRSIKDERVFVPCLTQDDTAALRGDSFAVVNNMMHVLTNLSTL